MSHRYLGGFITATQDPLSSTFATGIPSYVTSGLIAYWDADNAVSYPGSGNIWYTTAGGSNNAMYMTNGTYTYTAGSPSYFSLTGSSSWLAQDTPVNLPTTGDSTVLIWCMPDSTGPSNQYTGLVSYGSRFTADPSNARLLSLYTSGSTMYVSSAYWGNDYVPNSLAVTADAWNMVGMIARGGGITNNTTLYSGNAIGGLQSQTGTSSAPGRTFNTTVSNLAFGMTDYPGRYYKGRIAIVMIYNRELTSAEVTQNYNAFKSRFGL